MNAARKRVSVVQKATGRDRDEWFSLLDAWGAPGRQFRLIADWLTGEHGVSKWWAQKLIVEYEQDRGLRPPGIRRDGTFTVTASKTVAVPVDRLFDAVVDVNLRRDWLSGIAMRERDSRAPQIARFDWRDGVSRVCFTFVANGPAKSQVTVEHARLSEADTAGETKTFWRERLAVLKTLLETQAGNA